MSSSSASATRKSSPGAASVLLTVSGEIPPNLASQVAEGRRPRADYAVMADVFGADLIDVEGARRPSGRFGRLLERVGGRGLLIAWACFRIRSRYRVIVTDGEQVGIPLAVLCRFFGRRGSRQMMIVHVLSVPKKAWLVRVLRLAPLVDRFVVYCSWQRDFLTERLGASADQVVLTPFMVDTRFFDPAAVDVRRRRMICTAGLERRDYPTLMEAVEGLDVDVVIAAASPWSKQTDSSADRAIPSNVVVQRFDQYDLRALYAESAFVVMPLVDVDFQAGITAILEAMAMERAVICTRTPGQTDTIVDGETGLYVQPGDPIGLRRAIEHLLAEPAEADRLGAAGRRWAVRHAEVGVYAGALAGEVAALSSNRP